MSDLTRIALRAVASQGSANGQISVSERTELRLQTLSWLRAYVEVAIKLQDSGEQAGWSPASWQTDSTLAVVRDPAELAKLPAPERGQWQLLWADVAAQVAADPLGQGRARAARREWAKAADCYARVLKQSPMEDGHFWFEYCAVLLLAGDKPGYNKACLHMVEAGAKSGGPRAYHVARACTLGPDPVIDATTLGRLAEAELQASADQFWSMTEQGALAYRAGRFQTAVPMFEQSIKASPQPGSAVVNWLWLALANQRLGKTEEAQRCLNRCQLWLDQYREGIPPRAEQELGLHLHNWLEANVLRHEAEAMIPSTTSTAPSP